MHRLVTDPLSGRCLERSTTAYRFDAAMRAQILAADHSCRAPGCLVAGALAQIDHVQEFGTDGGATREANGALEHTGHHDQKTKKALEVTINASREMTWTTLLGKIYRTKAHDYNQYSALVTAATAPIQEAADATERAGLIDAAIYQALSYRPSSGDTYAPDDLPDTDGEFEGWDLIVLTHTDPTTGRRRYRPAPQISDAEKTAHQDTDPQHRQAARPEPHGSAPCADDPEDSATHPAEPDVGHTTQAPTAPQTAEHGPWAIPDDEPPPF